MINTSTKYIKIYGLSYSVYIHNMDHMYELYSVHRYTDMKNIINTSINSTNIMKL